MARVYQQFHLLAFIGYLMLFTGCSIDASLVGFGNLTSLFSDATGLAKVQGRSLVRNSNAGTLLITCDVDSTDFILSSTPPSLTDSGWNTCTGIEQPLAVNIASGINAYKVWFKSTAGVGKTPALAEITRSESHIVTMPATELGANNYAYQPYELGPNLFIFPDPYNDVNGVDSGAVHLKDVNGNIIRTIRGRHPGDKFSSGYLNDPGILILSSNRFLVISPSADSADGLVADVGSIVIFDNSGNELWRVEGDNANDKFGESLYQDAVYELPNGNILIRSYLDDVNGLVDAGSVSLYNGATGALINQIVGDVANDKMGYIDSYGLEVLTSAGLIMIASEQDSISGGAQRVGSLVFMNPDTGAIVNQHQSDNTDDRLGYAPFSGWRPIYFLSSGVIAVTTAYDDVGGVTDCGSFKFFDPASGALLQTIAGDAENRFGDTVPIELINGNIVVYTGNSSSTRGRVVLLSGDDYSILASYQGDPGDYLSYSFYNDSVFDLKNGNFMVMSESEKDPSFNEGTVRIIDGTTGILINTVWGDTAGGFQMEALPLENGNIVAFYPTYGVNDVGRMVIINGLTGAVLQSQLGLTTEDLENAQLSEAPNGNILIGYPSYDLLGVFNVGCAFLFNGSTGAQIQSYCGASENDLVGDKKAKFLPNGNLVFSSPNELVDGLAGAGLVRLINSITGEIIHFYSGENANDNFGNAFTTSNNNFLIASSVHDNIGLVDVGRISFINGDTGEELATYYGDVANDKLGGNSVSFSPSGDIIIYNPNDDIGGLVNVGSHYILDKDTGALKHLIPGITAGDSGGSLKYLSNGDILVSVSSSDTNGLANSGAYILIPND